MSRHSPLPWLLALSLAAAPTSLLAQASGLFGQGDGGPDPTGDSLYSPTPYPSGGGWNPTVAPGYPGAIAHLDRCRHNQTYLAGAVSLYNLDHNENVTSIPWGALVSRGYLPRSLNDPGYGRSSHWNYQLTAGATDLGVTCQRHGTREDIAAALGSGTPGPGTPPAFGATGTGSGRPASGMERARCRAQQLLVVGAVAAYNLDQEDNLGQQIPWAELTGAGGPGTSTQRYLPRLLEDPGQGTNSFMNYALDPSQPYGIRCVVHGNPQEIGRTLGGSGSQTGTGGNQTGSGQTGIFGTGDGQTGSNQTGTGGNQTSGSWYGGSD